MRHTFQAFRLSDRMLVTRSMLTSFSTLNYGINFYVYVLSSSKFRHDLQLTFSCIRSSSLAPTPPPTQPCNSNPANISRPVDLIRSSLNRARPRSSDEVIMVEVEDHSVSTLDPTVAGSCEDDDVRGNERIVVWTTRIWQPDNTVHGYTNRQTVYTNRQWCAPLMTMNKNPG